MLRIDTPRDRFQREGLERELHEAFEDDPEDDFYVDLEDNHEEQLEEDPRPASSFKKLGGEALVLEEKSEEIEDLEESQDDVGDESEEPEEEPQPER